MVISCLFMLHELYKDMSEQAGYHYFSCNVCKVYCCWMLTAYDVSMGVAMSSS